jgi:hypothetical protein
MKILKILLQVLGVLVLVLATAILTLRIEHRNADGPSILFPGGAFTTGEIYTGPEPDWRFTDDISVIELQTDEPLSSRRTWIMESNGKIYVPSGYMRSFLGRIWKDWAFQAAEGDGYGAIRINGVRYPRRLVRITGGPELDGVVAKMRQKYAPVTREAIEAGDIWIFELAPREG